MLAKRRYSRESGASKTPLQQGEWCQQNAVTAERVVLAKRRYSGESGASKTPVQQRERCQQKVGAAKRVANNEKSVQQRVWCTTKCRCSRKSGAKLNTGAAERYTTNYRWSKESNAQQEFGRSDTYVGARWECFV